MTIVAADQEVMQLSHALHNLCVDYYGLGDYLQAYQYGMEALAVVEADNLIEGIAFAQLHLGHVLAEMQHYAEADHAEADHALTVALEAFEKLDWQPHVVEASTGLGHVARLRGDLSTARAYAERTYSHLLPTPISGMDEPIRAYLHCYQVFAACNDPRAQNVLEAAHRYIQTRAALLEPVDRERFLSAVPANRAILAAWGRNA
jgi:hypothetical protein